MIENTSLSFHLHRPARASEALARVSDATEILGLYRATSSTFYTLPRSPIATRPIGTTTCCPGRQWRLEAVNTWTTVCLR
jgi:hypothetical protein